MIALTVVLSFALLNSCDDMPVGMFIVSRHDSITHSPIDYGSELGDVSLCVGPHCTAHALMSLEIDPPHERILPCLQVGTSLVDSSPPLCIDLTSQNKTCSQPSYCCVGTVDQWSRDNKIIGLDLLYLLCRYRNQDTHSLHCCPGCMLAAERTFVPPIGP